jgi:tRNA U38,U39,U40 pseudouridine synthase TruA
MPRFKITCEYEGTRFSGWQVQKNARTVQGLLVMPNQYLIPMHSNYMDPEEQMQAFMHLNKSFIWM